VRSTKQWLVVGTLAAFAAVCVVARGDKEATPPAKESARPDDEKVIRETAQALAKAFAKGDAAAVASFWTEDGEYVDEDGKPVHGRAALEKAYTKFFAKRPEVKVESKTNSVRFLGKDTAIEEGTFTVTAKNAPPDTSRYSALYARQDGKWLIALLKEWDDDEDNQASLQDLAWLIGTWETDGGDSQARTTYEWTENKAFIRSKYTVTVKKEKDKGTETFTGTQIIGIDPGSGLIHAWTFDANGGVGEANWVYDGQRWVIDSDGTLPDGTDTTATNFLTRTGDDTFTWRSVSRTADGEPQPDIPAIKVKRVRDSK
jgi:uncharacterized protein (TIGR02246 family)